MATPTVVTDRAAFREVAADAPPDARVPVEVRVRVTDPFDAYRRGRRASLAYERGPGLVDALAVRSGFDDAHAGPARSGVSEKQPSPRPDGGVYLETTGGQAGWGYFAVDPIEHLRVSSDASVIDPGATVAIEHAGGAPSPSLAALQGVLDGESLARGDCDVPFPCGAFGWLSYDVARELEELPDDAVDDRTLPHLSVGVYDRVAAWEDPPDDDDDGAVTLRITACPRVDGEKRDRSTAGPDSVDAAYDRGLARARALALAAVEGDPSVGPPPVAAGRATFESDCGPEAFAERVRRVKEYVREGDTFQTNVSQRLVAPAAVHPVAAFEALRAVNPAPYSALLEFPAVDLVSASPELLLERRGDFVRTEPIAGTRPRGTTPGEDDRLEADLLGDEKERAEHAMLVDLERNDLGKVCEFGSVAVEEYRRVDRYSEVMHLVSSVVGRLRPEATLADAVAAVFPGGTITGAPKPRTMEIVDELESTRRGPYTGSIGVFGFDDRATLNIVIRTLVRHGEEYHLRVGAGVVHDSVPDREHAETLDKARALVTAVDEALGERTELAVETDGGESDD